MPSHLPPTPKQQQKLCDAWNAKHPVGTQVTVKLDSGETKETTTTTEAQLLSGHTAVIWLEDVSGCYCLDFVKAT
jgi:hypothetical protein